MDRGEIYELDTLAALSGLGDGDLLARVLDSSFKGALCALGSADLVGLGDDDRVEIGFEHTWRKH